MMSGVISTARPTGMAATSASVARCRLASELRSRRASSRVIGGFTDGLAAASRLDAPIEMVTTVNRGAVPKKRERSRRAARDIQPNERRLAHGGCPAQGD